MSLLCNFSGVLEGAEINIGVYVATFSKVNLDDYRFQKIFSGCKILETSVRRLFVELPGKEWSEVPAPFHSLFHQLYNYLICN